jgi:hypothetical protein
MAKPYVASSLAYDYPALPAEGGDELCAGDDWEAPGQAGNGSVRLTTPISRLRPSSRSPSM